MQRPRTPSKLSESVHRQLNMYALAASAAGVSLMALAQPVEGKIVYTPLSVEIGPNQYYQLDLNNDGIADFKLSNYYHLQGSATTSDLLSVSPANSRNEPRGYINAKGYIYASALKRGVEVNGRHWRNSGFNRTWRMAGTVGGYKGSCSGPWTNVKNRYLGLKFQVRGKTHYGWARLNVTCILPTVAATLTGYAYETVANKGIRTGKAKGPDVITLEPATLGHLARGASAIPAWRTKE